MDINDISIKKGERGLICGFAGSGKSTLGKILIEKFIQDNIKGKPFSTRGRVLIIDTKPRWKGTYLTTGSKATKLYKGYSPKTDELKNSVVIRSVDDFNLAFSEAFSGLVVYQQKMGGGIQEAGAIIRKFFETQDYRKPSLLYIDEGHDFYGGTGMSLIRPDIIGICFRAGREKGLSTLLGAQRPIAISKLCLTESNTLFSFALNSQKDRQALEVMGIPPKTEFPTKPHHFLVYKTGQGVIAKNATLKI